jgi:N12 class adenine-specific DNA methylase
MADDTFSLDEAYGSPDDTFSLDDAYGAPAKPKPVAPSGPGARALPVAPGMLAEPAPAESYDELGMWGRRAADLERGLTGMEAGGAATRVTYGMEEADVDSAFDLIDQGKVDEAFELAGPTRVNAVLAYRDATPEQRAELRAQRAENTDLPGQLAELMEVNKRLGAIPNNPRAMEMAEAGNKKEYGKAFDVFLTDPFGIIASVGTESLPAMAPGAAASMVAGPVVGMGMGSAWVEQASALQQGIEEAVRAAGGDPANPDDVKRILSDPEVRAALGQRADVRAGIVGLVDALSGGLASKFMGFGTKPITREMSNALVQMPVQGTAGAIGEGAAELVTTGEIKPGNMALEFLGESVTAPADIAVAALSGAKKSPETSLTPDPKPMGPLQGSRQPAPVTPSDVRSPIPTDLIQQGKTIVAQALAQSDANKILGAAGFPQIGARVTLTYPDGRKVGGSVVDAFSATANDTGTTDNGIKIKLDDGTVFEEFEDTIRRAGLQIVQEGASPTVPGQPAAAPGMVNAAPAAQGVDATQATDLNVSRDAPSVTPMEGQDVGGETVQQVSGAPAAAAPAVLPGVSDPSAAGQPSAPQGGVDGTGAAPAQPPAQVRQEGAGWAVDFGGSTYRGDAGKPFKNKAQADAFLARKLGDGSKAAPLRAGGDTAAAAAQANTSPSPAQIEADNYKKVHYKLHGLDMSIENPQGTVRRSKKDSPVKWEVEMPYDYGDIKGTIGADGDNLDVMVGPNHASTRTWVIDQIDPATGKFDEHKSFVGFDTQEQVIDAYNRSFSDGSGPSRLGAITPGNTVNFKRWAFSGPLTKALAYQGKTAAGLQGGKTPEQGGIPLPTEGTNGAEQTRLPPADETQKGQGGKEGGAIKEEGGKEQGTGAAGVVPPFNPNSPNVNVVAKDRASFRTILNRFNVAAFGDTIYYIRKTRDGSSWAVERRSTDGKVLQTITPPAERKGWNEGEAIQAAFEAAFPDVAEQTPQDALKAKVEEKRKPKTPQVDALPGMTPLGAKPSSKAIGKNAEGEMIYEDGRGVRSVEKNGVRSTEKVQLIPSREGTKISVDRSDKMDARYKPVYTPGGQKIEQAEAKRYEYDRSPAGPANETQAKRDIVDFMNGDITKPQLIEKLKAAKLERGVVNAITQRLGDDFVQGDVNAVAAPEIAKSPPEIAKSPKPAAITPAYGATNKLVSQDRAAELRERLKAKFKDLKNLPKDEQGALDPEMLALGTELAVFHIEAGARKFTAFAKAMAEDLGQSLADLRPYLRGWYNAARDMMEDRGGDVNDMDTPEQVKAGLVSLVEAEAASANIPSEETPDGATARTEPVGGAGDESLAGAPAGALRAPEGEQDAGERSPQGGADDGGRNGRPGEDGAEPDGGVLGGEQDAPVHSGGTGEESGADATVGGIRGNKRPDRQPERPGSEPGVTAPEQVPHNFVITDDMRIGEGGQAEKFRDNLAAIRLLKQLERENRRATPDEQRILARYVGWGGIKSAFPKLGPKGEEIWNKGWEAKGSELRAELTDAEYQTALRSVLDAHYTSMGIVDSIWTGLFMMGFRGQGRVLEPSMGIGNFFGRMPAHLRSGSAMTGVEYDQITGRIAKQLYQGYNILAPMGFQDAPLADGHFDIAIGNPPFGQQGVPGAKDADISKFSIHNYFFARTLNKLRPGGIMGMVVSRYFMDATTNTARAWISERAKLVGAIRLPNTAFQENALTEVTTDIIFFQKLGEGEKSTDNTWTGVTTIPDPLGGEPIAIGRYFADHPEMMLGRMERSGTMRTQAEPTLAPDGRDMEQAIIDAFMQLPRDIYEQRRPANEVKDLVKQSGKKPKTSELAVNYDIGSYFTEGNKLLRRQASADGSVAVEEITAETQWSEKQKLGAGRLERLKAQTKVRDAARSLLEAESQDKPDAQIALARKVLNQRYDAFVEKHGYLSASANERLFKDDPDAPLLIALESDYDPGISEQRSKTLGVPARAQSAKKAAIFTRRVISPYKPVETADNAEDALAATLADIGRVDLAHMAKLTGMTEQALEDELSDQKALIYKDPVDGVWYQAAEYLAGNVKAKEKRAREAGLSKQADALKAAFPKDVKPSEISARIGANWIDVKYYEEFARHLFGERMAATIRYLASTGGYYVDLKNGSSVKLRSTWGTERMNGDEILAALLTGKSIAIYDKASDGSRTINATATQAAQDKAAAIKEEFADWLMKNPERRRDLTQFYNDNVNVHTQPTFDGKHLKFPGKVPDSIIKFRRHQRNAIWRAISTRKVLLDHVVGAGKTFTIVAAAMEMRRMGLARKPMVVVPNHLVSQWATDFLRLYPGAKILTMRKKDFEKQNRRRMLARIATGDWDAVIMAHSSFGFVGMSPEAETAFIEKQIADIQMSIEALRQTEGKKSRTVADMVRSQERLRARIEELQDKPRDTVLTFEELGVDQLFVDESHEFKNLFFTTARRGMLGLGNPKGSKKAFDMFMKVRHLQQKQGGKGVVFATGTPISNSLSEVYTVQRFMDLDVLEQLNILSFDAWANSFGDIYSDFELDGTGVKLKPVNRLRKLLNVPEVMAMYRQYADSVTQEQIKQAYREENPGKEFPLPKVKGGKRAQVIVPRTEEQAAFFDSIIKRSENVGRGKENMLAITGDARKAALDMRLHFPSSPDVPNGKTHLAADNITEIWRRWEKDRGTQLVFLDLSIPLSASKREGKKADELIKAVEVAQAKVEALLRKGASQETIDNAEQDVIHAQEALEKAFSEDDLAALKSAHAGFSVYDDMRQKLLDRGIPSEEIAFIHDYNTDEKKSDLFAQVNAGKIRVLFGSTSKMGAGTNVQQRVVGLHHIDCPWRPSDIEQREGRVIRQGNLLLEKYGDEFEVELVAYATEQTYDARMWQVQEQKLIGIEGMRNPDGSREMDEVAAASASAAEMKAAATGNPLILEDVKLADTVRKLEAARKNHDRQQHDLQDDVARFTKTIAEDEPKLEAYAEDGEKALAYLKDPYAGNPPTGTVEGKEYTDYVSARDAISDSYNAQIKAQRDAGVDDHKITYAVDVNGKKLTSQQAITDALSEIWGGKNPFNVEIDGKTYNTAHKARQALKGGKIDGTTGAIGGFKFKISAKREQRYAGEMMVLRVTVIGNEEYEASWSGATDNTDAELAAQAFRVLRESMDTIPYFTRRQREAVETAKRELPEAEAGVGKPFLKAQALADARELHAAVRKVLTIDPATHQEAYRDAVNELAAVRAKQGGEKKAAPGITPPSFDAEPEPAERSAVRSPAEPRLSVSKASRGDKARRGDVELDGLRQALQARMQQLGIANDVALRVMANLDQDAWGWFHPQSAFGRLIEIDPNQGNPWGTLNHEAIHALKDMGLFTQAEWNALEAAARNSPLMDKVIRLYENEDADVLLEEVIAEMFRKYANRAGYGPLTIRGLLERISHFIQAVREVFRETGYARAQEILSRVESGEVGARDSVSYEDRWMIGRASKAQKPPRPKGAKDKLVIENAETNRRVQDAFKGIDTGEGRVAQMKEWLAHKWHGFSRHYQNLPDTAEYADVGQQLRKLEASPGAAKERIVRILREITEGMNQEDMQLFAWKVALDDLAWEVQQEHDLPFGLTPETFTSEKAKIDTIIAGRPDLTWAVRQRKLLIRDVANSMVKAGVLHRDQVKNPNYYRHQVLHYARAVNKFPSGTGKKLRTPYWAKRMGSTLDINLNLLEAEFDWLHKAMVSVDTVKTIDWIKKSDHNIRGQVVAAAKAHNDAQIKALIDAEGDDGPLHEQWKGFRQRIAMGLAKVKKALDDGLIYVPEEFEAAADNLTGDAANDANIFPFLAWIMDNDEAGASGAAQAFKAVSERREWVKAMLGPKYADPLNVGELVEKFAPEGYVAWQPDAPDANGKALRLYVSKSIPEQALQRMMEKALDGVVLPAEFSERIKRDVQNELKSALTVGASKYEMVITQELADTLNNLRNEFEESLIAALLEKPTRLWKLWTLFNPRRMPKYFLNNLSGDLDAVIAGNPHILKRAPKAARELIDVMVKKKKPTARYMEAVERGVFDSGFTLQEIPDINYLSDFSHLTKPMNWKNPVDVVKFAGRWGWKLTRGVNTWRENVFRYAAYLDYVERLESGMTPEQIGYGATRPEIVNAVGNKKDQAALMARDLIGDYGAISAYGQQLRRYVIPFWSFQEINLRRYWRLNVNAWKQGIVKGAKTSLVVGTALGLKTTLWLYIRMFAVYATINLWNYLMFDDEEDDLDPEERARLHLTLGKWNGELVTLRLNGSLSDIMSWFGFADALSVMYEVEKGRADLGDILIAIAKAPVNKVVNSMTPVLKTPIEMAFGKSAYPDVFDARPIRDNWRHLARTFSLEHEYDLAFSKPSRGYGRSWAETVVSGRDPGESAYNRIRHMVTDWEERVKGEAPYGGGASPRSDAYYRLRTAMKYGDKVAEADARKELQALDTSADKIRDMFKRAHPLGGLAKKDRGAFMQSLSAEERRVLGIAERWYDEVFR